uniref:Secoisolariciresinol dehydrogenase n=1 Tax=Sinopodophyllum hexandrum TaxID=93608 RepID=D3JX99_SINHE|nr:secoisolariciresinol dehydrogenase [Sinopodophyllum hexandrum]
MSDSTAAPNPRRLEGKVAIITGGASGIGEAVVRLFWIHGAKVVIADVQDDLGQTLCNELDNNSIYVHCDVTNEDDLSKVVDLAVEKFGKLDIMSNNPGILDTKTTSILSINKEDIERVLNVNLIGGFMGAKHAARVMVPARKGCILFTGSATASIACPMRHGYVASKQGLVGLVHNIAAELGQYGIRVNCISPYAVATTMMKNVIPHESPEQLSSFLSGTGNLKGAVLRVDNARAALYLASDEAQYVSGQNLALDGGYSITNPFAGMATKKAMSQR